MTGMAIRVYGTPAPQGSKRHVGHGVMVESSAKVKPWREAVALAAREHLADDGASPFGRQPVAISARFLLLRPKGHYGSGRNAGQVKSAAPDYPAVKPDLDKLVRSTLDALKTGGVLHDDAQVIDIWARKVYAMQPSDCGVDIELRAANDCD